MFEFEIKNSRTQEVLFTALLDKDRTDIDSAFDVARRLVENPELLDFIRDEPDTDTLFAYDKILKCVICVTPDAKPEHPLTLKEAADLWAAGTPFSPVAKLRLDKNAK